MKINARRRRGRNSGRETALVRAGETVRSVTVERRAGSKAGGNSDDTYENISSVLRVKKDVRSIELHIGEGLE